MFSILYPCRYVKWNLGRGIGLVARCEYDAIMPTQQGKVFINIKALNEWDSKVCVCACMAVVKFNGRTEWQ